MKLSLSLRTRFVVTFSIIIVIFTFILSSIVSVNFISAYRNEAGDALVQKALQMTNIVERFVWARTSELKVVGKLDFFNDTSDATEIKSVFEDMKQEITAYAWIGFIDTNGIVVEATDDILKGENMSAENIYKQALHGSYVGEVHEDETLGITPYKSTSKNNIFIDVSTPVYSDDGKLLGVIASYIYWDWLVETEKTIYQHSDSEANTEIIIINSSDNLVLLGPKDLLGTSIDLESIDKAKQGERGWTVNTWADGKDYFTAYVLKSDFDKYQNVQWIVLARQPIRSIYGYLGENVTATIKIALIAAIIFALIGLIAANRVTKPLKQLTIVSGKLRDGEEVEIPKLKGVKEIELLASSLDSLIKSLASTKGELGEMTGLANHDKLTQLPNRIALDNYLKDMIENNDHDLTFTFLYMDLDGFKLVNDTYGHPVGDTLLKEVAKRIKTCIASDEVVARIGGDEFVVVVNNSKEDLRSRGNLIANKIIKELSKSFIIDKQKVKVGCSVGGAIWNVDSTDINELTRMADQALYTSKNSGKGMFTYYYKDKK